MLKLEETLFFLASDFAGVAAVGTADYLIDIPVVADRLFFCTNVVFVSYPLGESVMQALSDNLVLGLIAVGNFLHDKDTFCCVCHAGQGTVIHPLNRFLPRQVRWLARNGSAAEVFIGCRIYGYYSSITDVRAARVLYLRGRAA